MDLTDIYGIFCPIAANTHSSQVHMQHSPRQTAFWDIKHLKCERTENVQNMFSGNSSINLEISNRKAVGKPQRHGDKKLLNIGIKKV